MSLFGGPVSPWRGPVPLGGDRYPLGGDRTPWQGPCPLAGTGIPLAGTDACSSIYCLPLWRTGEGLNHKYKRIYYIYLDLMISQSSTGILPYLKSRWSQVMM